MIYHDFVLRLDPADGGGLTVRLVSSPAGEIDASSVLPVVGPEVERIAEAFERLVRDGDEETFRDVLPSPPTAAAEHERIGTRLFEALFPQRVRELYYRCMGLLDSDSSAGLRIKLQMELSDPRLLAVHGLPWELLYGADIGFLGREPRISIVRHVSLPLPGGRPPRVDRLRVLVVAAQPRSRGRLPHLDREVRALVDLGGRESHLDVVHLTTPTLDALRDALRSGGFHILHFLGHGGFDTEPGEGFLYLEDGEGGAVRVSGARLAEQIPPLYLVVLNACQTARSASPGPFAGVAPALLRTGVSAVVAMQFPISDRAASAFSTEFYKCLAAGNPIDEAMTEGRLKILRDDPGSAEWATPVLFSRVSDSRLFEPQPQVERERSGAASGLYLPSLKLPPAGDLDVYRLLQWDSGLSRQLVGRDDQRSELLEWAQADPEHPRVRFLIGPGGSGKTRLAFEVADALRKLGWTAGFAPPGLVEIPPVRTTGLFVVLDYPEERRDETVRLLRSLSTLPDSPAPIRILLLSRQESRDWEVELSKGHARKFLSRQPVETGVLEAGDAQQLFEGAYHRLAAHRKESPPDLEWTEFRTWIQGEPELRTLPLFILAAAVHVVLLKRPLSALSGSAVLEALVERELDRMRNTADGLGLDPVIAERFSALSALSGGLDAPTLRRLAETSMEVSLSAPPEVIQKIGRFPWWNKNLKLWVRPEPDVLAAVHAWITLSRADGDGLNVSEWLWTALYGETVRGSAWARQADRVLYDILRIVGARAYLEARKWFTEIVGGDEVRASALEPLLSLVPVPAALTELAISVADLLGTKRPSGSPAVAELSNRLSLQLAQEGRFEEAVASATEAVRLYEELASTDPGLYAAGIASARLNQSLWLEKVGRTEEALKAGERAVEGYRLLAARDPQRYASSLALAVNNLSNRLSEVGRENGALTTIQEALDVRRTLARYDAKAHEPELARALTNLSSHLSAKGRYDEALRATQEALEIRRRLAQSEPSVYDPELAITLNNGANLLGDLRRPQEAIPLLREAITVHERLAGALPGRYESDLATNLNNLSTLLGALGKRQEALEAIERAVGLYRRLAATAPEAHELNLARSLNNLSALQRALGDSRGALSSTEEAVAIYRRLAGQNPVAHEAELATVLDGQQNLLADLGRHEEAVAAGEEAESILRRLAAAVPDRYAAAHARTLSNFSLVLAATAQSARALAVTDEAVAITRRLASAHPERYRSELAQGLNNRSLRLLELGRLDEAVSAGREAVAIRRAQSARLPDRFEPDLARALSNLSLALAEQGSALEAVDAAEEARQIYHRFHGKEPRAWARRFVNTLSVLGKHQLQADLVEAAVATLGEAVPLARALAKENPSAHAEMFRTLLQRYLEALTRLGDEARRAAIQAELASWTGGE